MIEINWTREQPTGILFNSNENSVLVVANQTLIVKVDLDKNLTKTVLNTTDLMRVKGMKGISQNLILINDAKVGLMVIDTSDIEVAKVDNYLSLPQNVGPISAFNTFIVYSNGITQKFSKIILLGLSIAWLIY